MAPPPCKFTWRVVIGWVPAETNGMACPAEEHCDTPQTPGTVDGQVEFTECIGTETPGGGGTLGRKKKRAR